MDILKNLKSIFVVENPTNADAQDQAESDVPKTAPTSESNNRHEDYTHIDVDTNSSPKVDEKFLAVLFDAISKKGKEGFDYLEYKQSLSSLAKLSMDEQTRYQSAFAVAQTMGATPSLLIDTANYYLGVLADEEKAFEETLKAQMQKQIGDREAQTKGIQEAIDDKIKQIERLNQEINTHKQQLQDIMSQINDSTKKIEVTKQNFHASYNQLVDQISNDIQKMKKYLK